MSLGEILNGDRLWMSDYQLQFGRDEPCISLCDRITKPEAAKFAADLIRGDYMVNWQIDGLPGSTTLIKPKTSTESARKFYVAGFPLGFVQDDVPYIHNHVMLVIRWHGEGRLNRKKSIVGFEVYPKSVSDGHCPGASPNYENLPLDPTSKEKQVISFTYSVYWREEDAVDYDHRYDLYVTPDSESANGKMHWFAIVNSLVLVCFLSIFAALVFFRTINTSAGSHGGKAEALLGLEDEVFFQPTKVAWLCTLAGTGVQLLFTMAGLCILLSTGLSTPTESVMSLVLCLFVFAGFFAGFSSVQFYRIFSAQYVPVTAVKISFLSGSIITVLCFVVSVLCSVLTYEKQSSRTIRLGTILSLVGIYVLLQVPISVIGGFVSSRVDLLARLMRFHSNSGVVPRVELPPITKKIVPSRPWYNRFRYSLPVSGLFPFGIIFVEMIFMYKSLWIDKSSIHQMYDFLFLTSLLLAVVVIEVSVISTYLRFSARDYENWQWKAFITCSCSLLIYLTGYSFYYLTRMKMVDAMSPVLYLTYSTMLNVLLSLACGSLGLAASTVFVYTIYSDMKSD